MNGDDFDFVYEEVKAARSNFGWGQEAYDSDTDRYASASYAASITPEEERQRTLECEAKERENSAKRAERIRMAELRLEEKRLQEEMKLRAKESAERLRLEKEAHMRQEKQLEIARRASERRAAIAHAKEAVAAREEHEKREREERNKQRAEMRRLGGQLTAKEIIEHSEIRTYYKKLLVQGSQGMVLLDALQAEAGIFRNLHSVQPPVLSVVQKIQCQRLLPSIQKAVKETSLAALRYYIGPDLYIVQKKFIEDSKQLYWSWLKIMMALSLLLMKEQALIEFIRNNPGVDGIVDSLSLQVQRSREWNDYVQSLKDHLHEIFAEDRSFLVPGGWMVPDDLMPLIQSYGRELLAKQRAEVAAIKGIYLAQELYTIKGFSDQLVCDARAVQKQQADLQVALLQATGEENIKKVFANFREEAARIEKQSTALDEHMRRIRESNIALVPLDSSVGLIKQGERQITLADYAVHLAIQNDNAREEQCLPILETLLQHGSDLSQAPVGRLSLPMFEVLLRYTDSRTPLRQMIRIELLRCVNEISKQWLVTRFFVDRFLGGRENLLDIEYIALELCLKREVQSLCAEDQLVLDIFRDAKERHEGSIIKGYSRFKQVLFAIEGQKQAVISAANEEEGAIVPAIGGLRTVSLGSFTG